MPMAARLITRDGFPVPTDVVFQIHCYSVCSSSRRASQFVAGNTAAFCKRVNIPAVAAPLRVKQVRPVCLPPISPLRCGAGGWALGRITLQQLARLGCGGEVPQACNGFREEVRLVEGQAERLG